MARIKAWEISDEFWQLVEPLIPISCRDAGKTCIRKPGGGRKRNYSDRLYFAAIVSVLRTGIIWNALPREKFEGVCSAMVHRKFQQWARAGVFQDIWRRGLAGYDALAGIAWHGQAADGSNIEAPLAQESIGPNPADRGKKWRQTACAGRREWRPFVTCRQRRQSA